MNTKNLSNIALYFLLILFCILPLNAQPQWEGNLNTRDPIYRSGTVGVGYTSPTTGGFTLDVSGTFRTTNTILLKNGLTTYISLSSGASYFNGGNVGIGTSTPGAKLNIHQSSSTNWTDGFFLSRQAGGGPVGTYMLQKTDGFYIKSSGGYNFMSDDGITNLMKIESTGNVGIGTNFPSEKLHVDGKVYVNSSTNSDDIFKIRVPAVGLSMIVTMGSNANSGGMLRLKSENVTYVELNAAGTSFIAGPLAVGKDSPPISGYKLDVDGKIRANEIVVNTGGADFVFEDNYNLKSLNEVESFIKENKHLPEIPTAKEVQENGVSLGEMQTKLLQKVEELTLYIIEQEKRIKELESR